MPILIYYRNGNQVGFLLPYNYAEGNEKNNYVGIRTKFGVSAMCASL